MASPHRNSQLLPRIEPDTIVARAQASRPRTPRQEYGPPLDDCRLRALAVVADEPTRGHRPAVGRDDFGDAGSERGLDRGLRAERADSSHSVPAVEAGGGEADARKRADHAVPGAAERLEEKAGVSCEPERLLPRQHASLRVLAEDDHGRRNGVGIDGREPGVCALGEAVEHEVPGKPGEVVERVDSGLDADHGR